MDFAHASPLERTLAEPELLAIKVGLASPRVERTRAILASLVRAR